MMSADSIELVQGMLDRDVEKRFSIEKVIGHAWCQGAV